MTPSPADADADLATVDVDNNLYGVQFGVDIIEEFDILSFGVRLTGGLYYNDIEVDSTITDTSDGVPSFSKSFDQEEIAATIKIEPTIGVTVVDGVTVSVGGFALLATGIAEGTTDFAAAGVAGDNDLGTDNFLVYGAKAGIGVQF